MLVAGLTMLLTGSLLFPVSAGRLSYYENGLYGLLLLIFALQIVTLGKTPFGDMRKSIPLLAAGVAVATAGIVIAFIPDLHDLLPRILLTAFFGAGGIVLLVQLIFAKDKSRLWMKSGGIFRHLTFACAAVYALSILVALLVWRKHLLDVRLVAVVALVYSVTIFYLAGLLWKIYKESPPEDKAPARFELPIDKSMILLTGVYIVILGILLIPVNMGLLPFAGSAQLGLLVIILAVRMLAVGNTPIGVLPRSWLLVSVGLVLAALGIVSCIVPSVLVVPLTILVGVMNIVEGAILTTKTGLQMAAQAKAPRGDTPANLWRLAVAQLVSGIMAIIFGTSMLVSKLIPGLVLGGILVGYGCVLLYTLYILIVLDRQNTVEVVDVPV